MIELRTPQPARHASPVVKPTRLAHLRFERPDLKAAEAFLVNFGLVVASRTDDRLFLRGTGEAPFIYVVERGSSARFLGFGLAVSSRSELSALTSIEGASDIEPLDAPGGGARVRLRDPSGFLVEVVTDQQLVAPLPHRPPLSANALEARPRVNATQRPPATPPEVLRLGHVVFEVVDYQATAAWYTRCFGLIPSDVQVLPDGSPGVTFFRLDLGDTPADHHTLALAQGFMPQFSHCAFEVIDADAVGMGHRLLREHGYQHAWGLGRHILGSQIFDYWEDPWGARHEHYCDGDVFTAQAPLGVHEVSREAMSQWGQVMPASFTRPKLTPSAVLAMLKGLRTSPDLTVQKLLTLGRIFG